MTQFARAHQRMNHIIAARLSDGTGCFVAATGVRVSGLQLSIDSKFELAGALETLTASIKAVTVPKDQMRGVKPARGDRFELNGKCYLVEDTLSDDQHFPVYACQESA